jgi:hypothetical protein
MALGAEYGDQPDVRFLFDFYAYWPKEDRGEFDGEVSEPIGTQGADRDGWKREHECFDVAAIRGL